jgi:hypothetical protein
MAKNAASFNEILADADADRAARSNNAVPMRKESATRHARRAVTRVWNDAEVAKRALEVHSLVCDAAEAYRVAIKRASKFKERHGLERVDHKDPAFRAYTGKQWTTYVAAKREVKLAKARLTTACRNVLMQREADCRMFAAD